MEKFYISPKGVLSKDIVLSSGETLAAGTEVDLVYRTDASAVQVDKDNTLADILAALKLGTQSNNP